MNLLFLSLLDFKDLDEHNIYTDLLRKFYREGHTVCAVSPVEKRTNRKTELREINDRIKILKLQIGNIQKTNVIEKGISTLGIEKKFINGIKQYFGSEKFDLVLYTTPPITFQKVVTYVKKRDKAVSYLMLKDIFPQNAIDLGVLSKNGIKGFLYRYFRKKEKKLYLSSDYIGCMSKQNAVYLRDHNRFLTKSKIEICPNCIELEENVVLGQEKDVLRSKYGIPNGRYVLIYGGNLGKPQGIAFALKCIERIEKRIDVFFMIIGAGTEYSKIENFLKEKKIRNTKLINSIPKDEYRNLIRACDMGLIFLDHRFTIPNFPSRLLDYMNAELPVFAITDSRTDIKDVVIHGKLGYWCESDNLDDFDKCLSLIVSEGKLREYGKNSKKYLVEHFTVEHGYEIIMRSFIKLNKNFKNGREI